MEANTPIVDDRFDEVRRQEGEREQHSHRTGRAAFTGRQKVNALDSANREIFHPAARDGDFDLDCPRPDIDALDEGPNRSQPTSDWILRIRPRAFRAYCRGGAASTHVTALTGSIDGQGSLPDAILISRSAMVCSAR